MQQHNISPLLLLKSFWKHLWQIILVVLVAGGAAFGVTERQPIIYEATATVMVENQQPKLDLPAGLQLTYLPDVTSQVEIMRSNSVIERAIAQLEPDKEIDAQYIRLVSDRIRSNMRISQVKGSNIIAISISDTNPQIAQKQANGVADAFVYEAQKARLSAVENSIEKTNQQMKELATAKFNVSINPDIAKLASDIKTVIGILETASAQYELIGTGSNFATKENESSLITSNSTLNWPLLIDLEPQVNSVASQVATIPLELESLKSGAQPISTIEGKIRKLTTNIQIINVQIQSIRKTGSSQEIDSKIINIQKLISLIEQDWNGILEQVIGLYSAQNSIQTDNDTARFSTLIDRIGLRTGIVGDNLYELYSNLNDMQQLTVNLNQSQIDGAKKEMVLTSDMLQEVLQNIQPKTPDQNLLLTYEDLSNAGNRARAAVASLTSASALLVNLSLDRVSPQVYAQLTSIKGLLDTAAAVAERLPDGILGISNTGQSNLNYEALNNLRQQLQLSLVVSDSGGIRVVDRATVSAPVSGIFGRYLNVVLAIVAALLLSILTLLVFQYFDLKVHESSQVTSYSGLPLLASVSSAIRGRNLHSPSILDERNKKFLESFRILRTNLRLDSPQGKILLITSPQEKEGKTTVAANLARAVALQGRKVLLIDGDVVSARPGIPKAFSLQAASGLTELVTGKVQLADGNVVESGISQALGPPAAASLTELVTCDDGLWAYATQEDSIDIISLGKVPSSSEITSCPRMKDFILNARKLYDVLIIDSSPALGNADTGILAKQADEVLLVLRKDVSRLDLAKESKVTLESVGARVVGFVLIG